MIPVCEPYLTDRELELVSDCVKSGWISSAGQYLDDFESKWAAYCSMPHGIAVSNGSVALDLAMELIQLQPGDEVILPSFTIISCAQAVTAQGGVPVLVDMNADDWQMNVHEIAEKITDRTKAIMVVHLYGHPADMDPILQLASDHDLAVIEDAAEVHGAEYKGKKCGSFGNISTFSFYANKLVTTGEGGMILTKTLEHAERARSLRNLCFQKERRFLHEELGNNFRLTNLQAALGVAQVERIEETVDRKRAIAQAYTEGLSDLEQIQLPIEKPWAKNVYWVYGLVLHDALPFDAAALAQRLREKKIDTRPFFLGMHEQPVFKKMGLFHNEQYPVTERLARRGLYLPSGLALTESEIEYIIASVRECVS